MYSYTIKTPQGTKQGEFTNVIALVSALLGELQPLAKDVNRIQERIRYAKSPEAQADLIVKRLKREYPDIISLSKPFKDGVEKKVSLLFLKNITIDEAVQSLAETNNYKISTASVSRFWSKIKALGYKPMSK